jgi:hypothetical protein
MDDEAKDGVPPITDLWDAELLLWRAYSRGTKVDLRTASSDSEPTGLDAQRRVRAKVLAALLLGAVDPEAGCVPGVSVVGAPAVDTYNVVRHMRLAALKMILIPCLAPCRLPQLSGARADCRCGR